MSKILGIDPGLQKTGWAIIERLDNQRLNFIAMGLIKTQNTNSLSMRLLKLFNDIQDVVRKYSPGEVAIEETYVNTNYQTSLHLSHARAALIVATAQLNLHPECYKATVVKKAITGSGNADKAQVLKMLSLWIENLPQHKIKNFDVYDALAISACHARYID